MAENAKVAIRSIRRDAIDKLKGMKKNSELTEDDLKDAEKKTQLTDDLQGSGSACEKREGNYGNIKRRKWNEIDYAK